MESSASKCSQVHVRRSNLGFDFKSGTHFTGKRFYEFEPTVKSVLKFLRSERFMERLDEVEDRKQRRFVKKFLKCNALERNSAQVACTSSIFESATVTISKPLVSRAERST